MIPQIVHSVIVYVRMLYMEQHKDIVVIYHDHCQDGFGAAFAAYKKFGDTASYIPCSDRVIPPEGLENKEIYILDFSYPEDVLLDLEARNKKVVGIDHHITAKQAIQSLKESVFSEEHSGAYLAWEYFVGGDVPKLVGLLEIIDLARNNGEYTNIIAYILSKPYTFEAYQSLCDELEASDGYNHAEVLGKAQSEYLDLLIEAIISEPDFARFEGYTVPCVNFSLPLNEKSIALKKLYTAYPPFTIGYRFDNGLLKVSLRGDGSVDLSQIASKYGGGGHRGASGFVLPANAPLPFTVVVKK